jgi:Uncharacterized protein conserved in bacteria (DUF2252)
LRPGAKTASRSYLVNYAGLCGWALARALARAHARSGDRVQIAAYLGKSERFDVTIADFAVAYAVAYGLACADQHDQDHAALRAAVKAGRVEADADT